MVVADADAPGLDGPHSSLKYAMYLLGAGFHPGSPETLGVLVFDQSVDIPANPPPAAALPPTESLLAALADPASDPLALAQRIFDRVNDARVAEIAKIAVSHPSEPLRKAGLLLLARRAEIPAPVDTLTAMLAPPKEAGYAQLNGHDWRTYALISLAVRGKLPVHDWFGVYTRLMAAQSLELTYLWCLGINGDRAAASDLVKLLYDSNLRVRIKAAMALGQLGDPQSLPALEEMAAIIPCARIRATAIAREFLIDRSSNIAILGSQPVISWHAHPPVASHRTQRNSTVKSTDHGLPQAHAFWLLRDLDLEKKIPLFSRE